MDLEDDGTDILSQNQLLFIGDLHPGRIDVDLPQLRADVQLWHEEPGELTAVVSKDIHGPGHLIQHARRGWVLGHVPQLLLQLFCDLIGVVNLDYVSPVPHDAENISLAAAAEGLILQRIGLPRGTGEQPACRAPHRAGGTLPGARPPRRIAL